MKQEEKIFELFDNISSIEPSANWDEMFYSKLKSSKSKPTFKTGNVLLVMSIALILVNVFSVAGNLWQQKNHHADSNLKIVAKQFLISTSSSKY